MKSLSFYATLFGPVASFYLIPPFSWAYVTYSLWYWPFSSYSTFKLCLFSWCILEAVFSVYYNLQANRISTTIPESHATELNVTSNALKRALQTGMAKTLPLNSEPERSPEERGSVPPLQNPLETLQFDDPRAQDYREYMRTWFNKKSWDEIHVHEVRQWLYWILFNATMPAEANIPAENKALLDETLPLLQKRAGATFKEGSNPECKPILVTTGSVIIRSRPLFLYVCLKIVNTILEAFLVYSYHFERRKLGHFEYLIRKPLITTGTRHRPLVLIHGLGFGHFHYYPMYRNFSTQLPSHYIMIPIQPHISQDIFNPRFLIPPTPKESAKQLYDAIVSLGWGKCGVDLLTHSNGTFYHAWMIKYHPELIKRSCFVDPVSFCTWEGDLCYRFFYQPCLTTLQLKARYFVCSELGVANVLQRHFDWISNSLWFEDVPNALDPDKTLVMLGGKDVLLNMERVYRYLRSHGLAKSVWFDPEAGHSGALSGAGLQIILRWLRLESEPQQ